MPYPCAEESDHPPVTAPSYPPVPLLWKVYTCDISGFDVQWVRYLHMVRGTFNIPANVKINRHNDPSIRKTQFFEGRYFKTEFVILSQAWLGYAKGDIVHQSVIYDNAFTNTDQSTANAEQWNKVAELIEDYVDLVEVYEDDSCPSAAPCMDGHYHNGWTFVPSKWFTTRMRAWCGHIEDTLLEKEFRAAFIDNASGSVEEAISYLNTFRNTL